MLKDEFIQWDRDVFVFLRCFFSLKQNHLQFVIDYYFDTNQADMYRFAFGNSIDQIVSYAQWNISKDEM